MEKKDKKEGAFWKKKNACDAIRKENQEEWTITDIQTLLTYKKKKEDPAIKNNKKKLPTYDG